MRLLMGRRLRGCTCICLAAAKWFALAWSHDTRCLRNKRQDLSPSILLALLCAIHAGMRVLSSDRHLLLRRVPPAAASCLEIGSTSPGALLYDARRLFDSQDARATGGWADALNFGRGGMGITRTMVCWALPDLAAGSQHRRAARPSCLGLPKRVASATPEAIVRLASSCLLTGCLPLPTAQQPARRAFRPGALRRTSRGGG